MDIASTIGELIPQQRIVCSIACLLRGHRLLKNIKYIIMKTSISQPYRVKPYVLDRETAPAYWLAGSLWFLTATGQQTGNQISMLEQLMPQGPGPASHSHAYDEGFYIIEGQMTFYAGGQTKTLGTGGYLHIPRFCEHTFKVDSENVRVLNYYTPAGVEVIVMSLAQPALSRTMPSFDAVPLPSPEQVEILAKNYGQFSAGGTPFIDKPEPANMVTTAPAWTPVPLLFGSGSDKQSRNLFGQRWKIFADRSETGGCYSLCEVETDAGFRQQTRREGHDQAIYLLEGSGELVMDEVTYPLNVGAFAYIPEGTLYSIKTAEKTRRLHFILPAGFEQVINEFGSFDTNDEDQQTQRSLSKFLYEEGTTFFGTL